MKRTIVIIAIVLSSTGLTQVVSSCSTKENLNRRGAPIALIYRGPATCSGCPEAVADLLRRQPLGLDVRFIGPGETIKFSSEAFASAALYVQPGGSDDVNQDWENLNNDRNFSPELIRSFVSKGGRYLGICMGGYLAGKTPGFDLLPGDTGEFIGTPGASINSRKDTLVDVLWRGKRRKIYFQDGPYFSLIPKKDTEILAFYTNHTVAIAIARYGSGWVAVSGPHPEAPHSWYEENHIQPDLSQEKDIANDLVMTLLRK